MLLVIDVGNSNNVIGLFSGEKLLTHWRIRTEWNRTADEYWVLIKEFILYVFENFHISIFIFFKESVRADNYWFICLIFKTMIY